MARQKQQSASTIVIGALGTNDYKPTTYQFTENEPTYQTPISLAALAADKKAQQILVISTTAAQEKNGRLLSEETLRLCQLEPTFIPIEDGKDIYELWDIFQVIADNIPSNAQVYADITNGFRSLPLLMNSALVYLTQVKGIEIKEITYGAFEAKKVDITPVFDITPFTSLIEWSAAVNIFSTSGDCAAIANMLNDTLTNIVDSKYFVLEDDGWERLPQEIDDHFEELQNLLQQFSEFADMLYIIRLTNLAKQIVAEIDAVRAYLISPIATLFQSIQKEFEQFAAEPFTKSTVKEQLAKQIRLMDWMVNKKHYFQAIAVAREWFVTWAMQKKGGFQEDDFLSYEKRDSDLVADMIDKLPPSYQRDANRIWKLTKELRNELAHSGYSKSTKSSEDMQKNIKDIVKFLANKGQSL